MSEVHACKLLRATCLDELALSDGHRELIWDSELVDWSKIDNETLLRGSRLGHDVTCGHRWRFGVVASDPLSDKFVYHLFHEASLGWKVVIKFEN